MQMLYLNKRNVNLKFKLKTASEVVKNYNWKLEN